MFADHYLLSVEIKDSVARNPAQYPFCIPAIATLERIEFHPNITFFVGENGSGKSTLLEALAVHCGFGEEGGTKNVRVATAETVSDLKNHLRVAKGARKPKDGYFLRAESFYNIATYMDQVGYLDSYGGKSLHEQSHGESFLALLTKKFRGEGIYFLDEPEAALSPKRQLAALVAIGELIEKRSQFVVATHSPILLAYPNASILHFDDNGIKPIAYEETEHFKVTRQFLNDYKRHANYLLRKDLPLE
jgi:predicted ATPase